MVAALACVSASTVIVIAIAIATGGNLYGPFFREKIVQLMTGITMGGDLLGGLMLEALEWQRGFAHVLQAGNGHGWLMLANAG
ncbi:hypothetical protein [Paraburkholderia bonniea]|uniref:hypothetical protein n=1 Tax=Paraburkholderia bonniea TaxID=2152891 RepID=UPI0012914800|nr:hypothetical protein [Paraburkholderia bonniea]